MIRKRTPVLPKKTILIATSNPAVAAYFSRVRKDCRYGNMTVVLVEAQNLEELIKNTAKARIAGKYACAYAVFNFDDFGIRADAVIAARPLAEAKKVKLAWNAPSMSLWLFLHLKGLNAYVDSSASFDGALSKVFPGYEATAEYMTNEGQDIHLRLFSAYSTAVNNARAYNRIAERLTGLVATSFPDFYEDIKAFCGEADMTHNHKLLSK